jgi:hypothetical protein
MSDDDTEIRDPQLLVLIEQSLDAQRLIVTWRKAHFDYGELLMETAPKHLSSEDSFTEQWSRISGVDRDDIAKLAPVLFENGILFEDGGVHETADGFVRKRGRSIVGAKG